MVWNVRTYLKGLGLDPSDSVVRSGVCFFRKEKRVKLQNLGLIIRDCCLQFLNILWVWGCEEPVDPYNYFFNLKKGKMQSHCPVRINSHSPVRGS